MIKCDVIITVNCCAFIRDLHFLNVEINVLGPKINSAPINDLFVCRLVQLSGMDLKYCSHNWQILLRILEGHDASGGQNILVIFLNNCY